MECVICKAGTMKEGKVTVTLQRKESIIVVKNVPAKVCENCGEYTLSEEVTRKLMSIAEQAVANNTEIEVLQYAA
jgi:YgiT-type zinc finger domain-containing protein